MAFPISPTNGQIYKGYKYNSTLGTWENISDYTIPNNHTMTGNFVMIPIQHRVEERKSVTLGTWNDQAWNLVDLSSQVPAETKSLLLFINAHLTGVSDTADKRGLLQTTTDPNLETSVSGQWHNSGFWISDGSIRNGSHGVVDAPGGIFYLGGYGAWEIDTLEISLIGYFI